ncbi:class I SAM-dependent methyltransferase [Vreelandella arcis]|uniref:Ubiquinone/menaquinone biosynthesis C-methylase UbiE n=1 Tax=Vreelandella arcis TaxID=416873 RepID=A0A1H0DMG4_9GAMM|nr:class I SAM-dependent methyltransferase [Halomonas arcis]SDN71437.1 Ubiquinone/menaquinone biosynthesis C-methylase UbiE [Halomonas arcis]
MTDSSRQPTGQSWNPEGYARHTNLTPDQGDEVLRLLAPKQGERILDLGCGDGQLTERIAKRGAEVLGIDTSEEMVSAAKARGLNARLIDAYQMPFDQEFDAVFSNATLHWMLDPQAVLASIKRALKPGGRFVAEFGGHGNVAAICTALIAALQFRGISARGRYPWYFPTAEHYRHLLETAGFKVNSIELIPQPTPLPNGMGGWLETFAGPFLHGLEDDLRDSVVDNTMMLLSHSLRDSQGNWTADYVRLRVRASI